MTIKNIGTPHPSVERHKYMISTCSMLQHGPKGVKTWTRILGLMHMPDLHTAHPDKILTQASVLAATGKRLPAHLQDAHPGWDFV